MSGGQDPAIACRHVPADDLLSTAHRLCEHCRAIFQ
jgi:hypothetical protein